MADSGFEPNTGLLTPAFLLTVPSQKKKDEKNAWCYNFCLSERKEVKLAFGVALSAVVWGFEGGEHRPPGGAPV